ncbi:MAG: hypothetical protein JSW73_05050 [Candidatus Woesearchaeota archaeon]|nr:MAG: hypothetical protein JSW73_05050 [Candidatus Woesearchaeota archaeon]
MKPELKLLISIFVIIALSTYVHAATEPAGAVVSGETDHGQYDQGGAGSVSIIESGNITSANLAANMSTYRWAGLTGNVSGDIILADANNETMYTWTAEGRVVYASNESSIAWSGLSNSTVADMPSYIAATDNNGDRYNNTFIGSILMDSDLFSIYARRCTTQSAESTNWYTYSLDDGTGVLVWAGEVVTGGTDYENETADYQILLPEDGTGGDETASTFYLWVELR